MARAHYTFAKGETQVIDLSQFTRGYDGGTYTVSAPSGVTATVSGSRLTVKLTENFAGADYVQFTLKDNAGDTFSRYIGVTQQLAASSATSSSSSLSGEDSVSSSSSETTMLVKPTIATKFHSTVSNNIVFMTGLPQNAKITVTDFSGNSIMTQKSVVAANGSASVNLQPFGCGIYLVNVRGIDDGIKLNKTIKVMRR